MNREEAKERAQEHATALTQQLVNLAEGAIRQTDQMRQGHRSQAEVELLSRVLDEFDMAVESEFRLYGLPEIARRIASELMAVATAEADTDWKQKYEEEYAIVDRVWKALGIETYEQAKGLAIDEIVSQLRLSVAAPSTPSSSPTVNYCGDCGARVPHDQEAMDNHVCSPSSSVEDAARFYSAIPAMPHESPEYQQGWIDAVEGCREAFTRAVERGATSTSTETVWRDFISETEADHFRTQYDTGADGNALFIWNLVRRFAGLPALAKSDLENRFKKPLPSPPAEKKP